MKSARKMTAFVHISIYIQLQMAISSNKENLVALKSKIICVFSIWTLGGKCEGRAIVVNSESVFNRSALFRVHPCCYGLVLSTHLLFYSVLSALTDSSFVALSTIVIISYHFWFSFHDQLANKTPQANNWLIFSKAPLISLPDPDYRLLPPPPQSRTWMIYDALKTATLWGVGTSLPN